MGEQESELGAGDDFSWDEGCLCVCVCPCMCVCVLRVHGGVEKTRGRGRWSTERGENERASQAGG